MHHASRTRAILAATLLVAALLAFACDRRSPKKAPADEPPTVSYMELKEEPVTLHMELPGRAQAFLVAEVRPQVGGILLERRFAEGADVREGELLYRIDPAPYRAARRSAEAELADARAALRAARLTEERYRPLALKKAVSRHDYDNALSARGQAEARLAAAEARLERAAIDLAHTEVKSPVSGRIGRSNFTAGALVTQNQAEPLATVQRLDEMYVDLSQSSAEWLELREALARGRLARGEEGGLPVTLVLENGRPYARLADGEPITGRLQFSDVTVSRATGSITLRAVFPNPDRLLLPGMFVRAALPEGTDERAILVPQRAVSHDSRGRPVAHVLKDDPEGPAGFVLLEPRILEIRRAVGPRWLVASGLRAGERLVVEHNPRLRAGRPARAVPWTGTAPVPGE